jgi:hypothetical protein
MTPGLCRRTSTLVLLLLLARPSDAEGQDSTAIQPRAWRQTPILLFGVFDPPDEVGRDVNATGGEFLIARLGPSPVFGLSYENRSRFIGLLVTGLGASRKVSVRNEFDVAFPNHGGAPFFYMGEARIYPLGRLGVPVPVDPFFAVGAGGVVTSVDLDNIDDQQYYNQWAWTLGAGARLAVGDGSRFIELRAVRWVVDTSGPLHATRVITVTAGIGAAF